ncbi:rRNA maturation RNase YbeY [Clostridium sp. D2Q-11]|uniref:Endoribonuclease YbeY n=1 Tax=Anaeromonas frigoriresistens TaxID=2683708 RepID=A0A942Z504_9FIRM|nr:rRNA maturation RNase YbeY [Anaeromonas frigoriresistens]MBS4536901.1 rRNA maturation RNase YbeY [Anaeromonas frigoriresistens]
MEVYIDNRQTEILLEVDIEQTINSVVEECLKYEDYGTDYEISVSFVNNKEIKDLNTKFRGKNKETDVLSFPMEDENDINIEGQVPILGDIVISAQKAQEQAEDYNHSLRREIAYLTAHSMFHLMGYDHMNEEDKKIMRNKEKQIMKNLGIFKN